jgi:hypothetical protein
MYRYIEIQSYLENCNGEACRFLERFVDIYSHDLGGCCVTYKTGFGLDVGIY